MPTTIIRLPEDLKTRIASAAEQAGTTTHALFLEAIAEKALQVERRSEFDAEAEARYARLVATGDAISWKEMRQYLEMRLAGKTAKRPSARKLAR